VSCPAFETWLEALDGGLDAPDGAHERCASCARSSSDAAGWLRVVRESPPSPVASSGEFVARVVGKRLRRASRVGVVAMAAVAIGVVLSIRHLPVDEEPPVARGGDFEVCEVHEVSPGGTVRTVRDGDRVAADASLGFTVRNPGAEAAYLGVYGISATGRVGWFHPAYADASVNPELVRLDPGDLRTLPEQVALPLGPGAVRVVCWRSERQWRVVEADAAIERAAAAAGRPVEVERVPDLGGRQEGVLLWFGDTR